MSGAKPDTWMPLYIGDYLADTMHLTRDQHGAYVLLIMAYWRRGGALPDDDEQLAPIAKATLNEWRKALRKVMAPFFQIAEGFWCHKRIDHELAEAQRLSRRGKAGGDASAQLRANETGNKTVNKNATREPTSGQPNSNTSPSPPPSQKEESPSLRSGEPATAPEFDLASQPEGKEATNGRRRKSRISADWRPDEQDQAYALGRGFDDPWIEQQAERFRDHHLKAGSSFLDWNAAWRTWVQRAPEFARGPQGSGPGPNRPGSGGVIAALREL